MFMNKHILLRVLRNDQFVHEQVSQHMRMTSSASEITLSNNPRIIPNIHSISGSLQVCKCWKSEQNRLYQLPPTALCAFKGNLEDREDAEVSRKQP